LPEFPPAPDPRLVDAAPRPPPPPPPPPPTQITCK
jgi:hypothetical protein